MRYTFLYPETRPQVSLVIERAYILGKPIFHAPYYLLPTTYLTWYKSFHSINLIHKLLKLVLVANESSLAFDPVVLFPNHWRIREFLPAKFLADSFCKSFVADFVCDNFPIVEIVGIL